MKHYTYRGVPYTTATRRKNNSNNFTYRGVPYTASAANQRINARKVRSHDKKLKRQWFG